MDRRTEPQTGNKATVLPARPWPVYNVTRARAEVLALQLLTAGASEYRVRQQTKLSSADVRRLAKLAEEEARDPHPPRLVGRRSPRIQRSAAPPHTAPKSKTPAVHEGVQLTFALD